jgi:hypothetical protein
MPIKDKMVRFPSLDLDALVEIGEALVADGVTHLKTEKRGINVSAVIRYLIAEKLQEVRKRKAVRQ